MLSDHKRLVLVVDDEAALRKVSRLILEKAGYRVLVASSSQDALALSRSYSDQIDLLLSDVEMAGMSGLALARQMIAERPGIAVLLHSANPFYEAAIQFAFLAKPYSPKMLQVAIAQTLSRAQTVAPMKLELMPSLVTHGSYSQTEIRTPDLEEAEVGTAFVRPEFRPDMTEGWAWLPSTAVVLESRSSLRERDVLIRRDHQKSSRIDWTTMRTAARNLGIAAKERMSRWRLPHAVPVWIPVATVILTVGLFGLHQFKERRSAYSVSLAGVRGFAGDAEAPTGTPLILNLDVASLPRSASLKIQIVNSGGYSIWQKVTEPEGSEVHIQSFSLRPGIYFVRAYGSTGELLKEYELRVTEKH